MKPRCLVSVDGGLVVFVGEVHDIFGIDDGGHIQFLQHHLCGMLPRWRAITYALRYVALFRAAVDGELHNLLLKSLILDVVAEHVGVSVAEILALRLANVPDGKWRTAVVSFPSESVRTMVIVMMGPVTRCRRGPIPASASPA